MAQRGSWTLLEIEGAPITRVVDKLDNQSVPSSFTDHSGLSRGFIGLHGEHAPVAPTHSDDSSSSVYVCRACLRHTRKTVYEMANEENEGEPRPKARGTCGSKIKATAMSRN